MASPSFTRGAFVGMGIAVLIIVLGALGVWYALQPYRT
jgi:hypothetical protein